MNRFLLAASLSLAAAPLQAQQDAPQAAAPARIESREQLESSLRQALSAQPEPWGESKEPLPQVLAALIESNQPRSGDFLLALAGDGKSPLQRRAVNAFVESWKSMSAEQISAYLRAAMVFDVAARAHYPEGFNVYVGCSYKPRFGWGGFPSEGFELSTSTLGLLDGQPWDKPYPYKGPMAGTYPLQTGKLALGEHSVVMRLDFEFEHNGRHGAGQLESRPFRFSIVNSDQPDDLEGVHGVEDEGLLKTFFEASEPPADAVAVPGQPDPWRPQTTWKGHGLHCPGWRLLQPLPFALTFDVEIIDADGRAFKGDQVLVKAGQSYESFFAPYAPREFEEAHPNADWVPVQVVLQPSYERALCYPDIKSFYAGKLQLDGLHIKIIRPEPIKNALPPPG